MSSRPAAAQAFVWIWLPGATQPVPAGRLLRDRANYVFHYGQSYLGRPDRIAIYEPELPLRRGIIPLPAGLSMPSAIRDAGPDAWGRRVIINRLTGRTGSAADATEFDEIVYLLESGSERVGALDFQASATSYSPRGTRPAPLEELLEAAERVESGIPLTEELGAALLRGSAVGGARPKATIEAAHHKYIAKFSTSQDVFAVVRAEFLAMRLAALAGLDVARVDLRRSLGKDVLLVERFDRAEAGDGWHRRALVSALTLLSLDEMLASYASYEDLANLIRHRFERPRETLRELFARLAFNILCGNTDDHARNHSAFWDGRTLSLAPAYDICPQNRTGGEASQAMKILGNDNLSQVRLCLEASGKFLLPPDEAKEIINRQIGVIRRHWNQICDEAGLTAVDRRLFWGRQFLNPFAFVDSPPDIRRPDEPDAG